MRTLKSRSVAGVAILSVLAVGCGSDPDASGGGSDGTLTDSGGFNPFGDGSVVDSGSSSSSGGSSSSSGGDASASSSSSSSGGDATAPKDTAPDPCKFPDKPEPGEPGATCNGNGDCDSNWCVNTADGKRCTRTCVDCCPGGWKCDQAPGSDTTFICIPKLAALCLPCKTDAECGALSKGALCIAQKAETDLESASFCGGECVGNADCPAGFACKPSAGEKGSGKQCVRESGMCSCTDNAVKSGAEALCTITNKDGTCSGARKCDAKGLTACSAAKPVPELCNGKDDDCDGDTDENLAAQPCETKGAVGACKGQTKCEAGKLTCTAPKPVAEKCDGKDNDCDGKTDEGCDDDGDGYCAQGIEIVGLPAVCTQDAKSCNNSGAALPPWCKKGIGDCNDDPSKNGAKMNPAGVELCGDSIDNDCDGLTDLPGEQTKEPKGCKLFYADGDNDGVGAGKGTCLCSPSKEFNASQNTDCNDKNNKIHPGVKEICGNGIDDNCNNDQNEDGSKNCLEFWADLDGDGFGAGDSKCYCAPKGKFKVKAKGDCDDKKKNINPKAPELCNTIDDNCNGATDEADAKDCKKYYVDSDFDGYGDSKKFKCMCASEKPYTTLQGGDCNDNKYPVNPGFKERCDDSLDNDCDGKTDEEGAKNCNDYWLDADKDGYGNPAKKKCLCNKGDVSWYTATKAKDCNDNPNGGASINPDAPEVCDGKDNDCDKKTDGGCNLDGDGYCAAGKKVVGKPKVCPKGGGDCNDDPNNGGKFVYPGAKEVCNGRDDNCKSGTDEGCDDDGDGYCDKKMVTVGKPKVCPKGGGDCHDGNKTIHPYAKEICDNINQDCDSLTDEGCDDDNDGYCDKNMVVVGKPKTCQYGGGDCCDSDAWTRPGQQSYFSSKNKCGSFDYNCASGWQKLYNAKAKPHHICKGIACTSKAECVANPQGWTSSVPACGVSASWTYDYTWNGKFTLPLVDTCTKRVTKTMTQKCH